MPAFEETNSATASICAVEYESLNDGITPLPFVTRSITSSFDGFASSRFGPTLPLAPAAASVWHPLQPDSAKIDFPSGLAPPVVSPQAVSPGCDRTGSAATDAT